MSIVLVGLSHVTAPVSLRERLTKVLESSGCGSRAPGDFPPWWGSGFREFTCLSTCNRLEIYAVSSGTNVNARESIVTQLAELGDIAPEELEPHIYSKEDSDAINHLLRVACGLDSQMLGETQILGQVSDAFATARANG